jgi:radical SAM-linked protein
MVGLPGEDDEDLLAIGDLCAKVAETSKKNKKSKAVVNASIGLFVPKPHTPFQWHEELSLEEAHRRMQTAKQRAQRQLVKIKWNNAQNSILEGIFSRGDRRLGRVLELAVRRGARFDGWSELFDLGLWLQAMSDCGLSCDEYLRARRLDEPLPWDHIDVGVNKNFLRKEYENALEQKITHDCRHGHCRQCGVCDFEQIKPVIINNCNLIPLKTTASRENERITYHFVLQKTGPAKFLGHLDLINQLVRCFRRAKVEIAYSQGFHPHPLLKTASALPLGIESLGEEMEAVLCRHYHIEQLLDVINQEMPQGLRLIHGRRARPGEKLKDPQEITYIIKGIPGLDVIKLNAGIEAFTNAPTWLWTRNSPKGERRFELKSILRQLQIIPHGLEITMNIEEMRPKPTEVLQAVFNVDADSAAAAQIIKLYRNNQYIT